MNILEELQWRGLVHQCSDEAGLRELLSNGSVTLYCGFDPTADSLHVGNLLPMLQLMRFAAAGHRPLALIGGATGLIGDPSGKLQERALSRAEVVSNNADAIGAQLVHITGCDTVNNLAWTKNLSVIDFMREVGKHFSVNAMLRRDSVSSRLEGDGLSFTEFSYMLFQGNDFLQLAQREGCSLQIGGSDQFGNMCSGLDLLKKNNLEGFALTFPLMVKSDGTKFGKSESGTVWLSAEKTSPWEFHQFWLNASDADVGKLLRMFTFLNQEAVESLERSVAKEPHKRAAQKALAHEMTTLVHGAQTCADIEAIASLLFGGSRTFELSPSGLALLSTMIPSCSLPLTSVQEFKKVVVETGLEKSLTRATQTISEGALSICELGGTPQKVTEDMATWPMTRPLLIKKGKKHFALLA